MKSTPKRWFQWTLLLGTVAGVAQACGGSEEAPYAVEYRVETDAAAACGNGVLEYPEECDGDEFGGQSCASATMDTKPDGHLKCSAKCKVLVSGCTTSNPEGKGGSGGTGGSGTGGRNGTGGRSGTGGLNNGTGGRLR